MEYGLIEILLRILTGAVIGFCIGMTGVGGGSIVVPTLIFGFGMTPSVSVGTASLYTFLTKIYATFRHVRLQTINYRIAFIFLAGAIPGNMIASWYVNERAASGMDEAERALFQSNLKLFIATAMLASTSMLIMNLIQTSRRKNDENDEQATSQADKAQGVPIGKLLLGILLGLCVGGIVGSTALGTGVLAIPVLILCYSVSTSQGIGSSILIGLVLTLISSLIYSKGNQIHIPTAVFMSLGSIVGVYYGSKMTVMLSEAKLKMVVIGIIIIASCLMFFK